jgi:hypothetical protein
MQFKKNELKKRFSKSNNGKKRFSESNNGKKRFNESNGKSLGDINTEDLLMGITYMFDDADIEELEDYGIYLSEEEYNLIQKHMELDNISIYTDDNDIRLMKQYKYMSISSNSDGGIVLLHTLPLNKMK